ncbi:hypothetical protein TKK_0017462 [Trichogramma kaykai]
MGGTHFKHLDNAAYEIWRWCEDRNLIVYAAYISSKDNYEADEESRQLEPETEYSLSREAFEMITNKFGRPTIDIFASRANTKCEAYFSWRRDPNSVVVDAFTCPWTNLSFYAFPPFSIILKVLRKIKRENAEGILVVPDWPSQPWFPLFNSLISSEPIKFLPNPNLLTSSNSKPHPMWKSLSLVAAKVSHKVF